VRRICIPVVVVLFLSVLTPVASAGAVRAGFDTSEFFRNDDSFISVSLPFTIDFFGTDYTGAYLNNNGNITFDAGLSTYTPFGLSGTNRIIIAPFFADVDTRLAGNPTEYGTGAVDGFDAWGVSWRDVDYYDSDPNHTNRNTFQLILIDRSDIAAGDFDIEFNYDQIEWETGEASGSDSNGLGGTSARVGYSDGVSNSFELPGSAVNGAFLDSDLTGTALIHHSLNSTVDGRYIFNVRNGTPNAVVPLPTPAGLAGLGLGLMFLIRRIRRR
jgi:Nidogen-like